MVARIAIVLLLAVVACGEPPTEEERIRDVVEEFRAAVSGADADVVWDLFSSRLRSFVEEVRLLRAGISDWDDAGPLLYLKWESNVLIAEDAAKMTTREFHRAAYEAWTYVPALPPTAVVRIHGDRAEVDDAEGRHRWWLRREHGDWKYEMFLFDLLYDVDLEFPTGPGGHEYAFATAYELRMKKVHPVPLPEILGAGDLPDSTELAVRVAVDKNRVLVLKGETLDDAAFKERLSVYADRNRDLEHPTQYSVVPVRLAVHRELSWSRAEEVLWLIADPDIRMRHADFLTKEQVFPEQGVHLELTCRPYPGRVRHEESDVQVRIGNDGPWDRLRIGLQEALAALPDDAFGKGVRVIVSPDLPVGEALSTLAVIARRDGCEIVHVPAEKPFAGWTLQGKPVIPDAESELITTPTSIHLILVLR